MIHETMYALLAALTEGAVQHPRHQHFRPLNLWAAPAPALAERVEPVAGGGGGAAPTRTTRRSSPGRSDGRRDRLARRLPQSPRATLSGRARPCGPTVADHAPPIGGRAAR
jgi:hypothetical protein